MPRPSVDVGVGREPPVWFAEQYLRSLFEDNPDAVYALDLDGQIANANRACERISGYRVDELVGRPILTFVVPEDRERCWAAFEGAKGGAPQYLDCAILRKDGARAHLSGAKIPIVVDGSVVG